MKSNLLQEVRLQHRMSKATFAKLAPILFLAVFVAVLFYPFFFGGKMPAGQEDLGYYYPALFFYKSALMEGGSVLWDNSYFGGFPSFLNYFGGFLYPLHYVLFKFLPFFEAYGLATALPVFGGMFFSYLFGRANSFSITGSLILALGYTAGYTLGALDTGLSYANGFLVLPLLLFSILKAKQSVNFYKKAPFILLGILGGALGFLAGFPQTVLYGMAFSFFYALYLDLSLAESISWRSFGVTFLLFVMVSAGAVLALPQLVSVFDYVDFSVRAADYTKQVSERPPLGGLLFFLLPPVFDIPRILVSVPGIYIGALPLFFAVLAAVFFRDRLVRFFLFSYLLMFVMSFIIPPFSWLNYYLPIFSRISNPARWLYIGVFPLAFLASYGYERFQHAAEELLKKKSWAVFLKIVGTVSFLSSLGAAVLSLLLYVLKTNEVFRSRGLDFFLWFRDLPFLPTNYQWFRGWPFPREHYESVFRLFVNQAFLDTSGNIWFWAGVAFLPLSFFLLKSRVLGLSRMWFGRVALSFITLNTILVFVPYFSQLIPKEIILEEPVAVRAIKSREKDFESFRILSFLSGEGVFREVTSKSKISNEEGALINREILTGQIQGVYGLDGISGYESLQSARQNRLIETVIASHYVAVFDAGAVRRGVDFGRRVNNDALKPVYLDEKIRDLSDKLGLLSALNVKYILSPYPLIDERLKVIPIEDVAEMPLKLYLYENIEVMPRIYFAKNPVFWNGDGRDLLIEVSETKDFREKTFIECRACKNLNSAPQENKINVLEYKNGQVRIQAESENGGWLVFGESNSSGWIAEIDGKRVPIYAANYLFQSISVPAGEHEIKFQYLGTFRLRFEKLRALFDKPRA